MSIPVSLAEAQRSLGDPGVTYPLWPPLTAGCPMTSRDGIAYPLDITYTEDELPPGLFDQRPLPGLQRWAPLLPPLTPGLEMSEGGTPLLPAEALADWLGFEGRLFLKDETRNPTWSHKDRLNLCTVSAAVEVGAPGVVVASSGNHGASAAAYAARAGLPCIVLTTPSVPPAVYSFLRGYGAAVVVVPTERRVPLMQHIVDELGYHPVSTLTVPHTGHPFGPEGYKTIAYELFLQLGRDVPDTVFVPTGYAELLYGIWKGFDELTRLGLARKVPRLIACEPAARAPLRKALAAHTTVTTVDDAPTAAYAIGVTTNGVRGTLAIERSSGQALALSDEEMIDAQRALGRTGLWCEVSAAASLAGVRQLIERGRSPGETAVCIITSSGFKDLGVGNEEIPSVTDGWDGVQRVLRNRYGIAI